MQLLAGCGSIPCWDRVCGVPKRHFLHSLKTVGSASRPVRKGILSQRRTNRQESVTYASSGVGEEASSNFMPALRPLLDQRRLANISVLFAYSGASLMICSMGPVLGAMMADPSLRLTSANAGSICAFGNFGAVVGKAVTAALVFSLTPRNCYLLSLAGSAAAMSMLSAGYAVSWFAACYTISKFFFASSWVSATQLLRQIHPPEKHGAALGCLALFSRAGLMSITLLSSWLLFSGTSWRTLLLCTGALGTLATYIVFQFVAVSTREVKEPVHSTKSHSPQSSLPNSFPGFLRKFAKVRQMLMSRAILQSVMELQIFIVLFGQGFHSLTTASASRLLMCFSSGAAVSVFLSGQINCKLKTLQRRNFMVACCLATSVALLMLSTSATPISSCIWCGALGAFLAPPFYIAVPGFNLKFGGEKSAILEGGSEMLTMIISILTDGIIGAWIGKFGVQGWPSLLRGLSVLMIVGAMVQYSFLSPQEQH